MIDIEEVDSSNPLPHAVRRHIDRLVSRVARKDVLDRRILAFLVEHAPTSYSVHQIAVWTDCAQGVIENDPPWDFLNMGLVVRERRTDGLHYRSSLKAFVTREFGIYRPDIRPQELHLITQLLRTRFASLVSKVEVMT